MNERNKNTATATSQPATIPVVEERVHIGKQVVDSGRISFQKQVEEEVVHVPFVSRKTGYAIERIPINQYVEQAPAAIRYEGKTMILSVVEEEVVVLKRLKVVEEVHITPSEKEVKEDFEVKLKKERIEIKRDPYS